MKNTTSKFSKSLLLSLLLSGTCLTFASAAPESYIYSPGEIHHYASNGGASTVTVEIPEHFSFQNGKYVSVPNHKAEAPLPHDKYAAAYWVTGSTVTAGHWATEL
jgi:hypothetical protein